MTRLQMLDQIATCLRCTYSRLLMSNVDVETQLDNVTDLRHVVTCAIQPEDNV